MSQVRVPPEAAHFSLLSQLSCIVLCCITLSVSWFEYITSTSAGGAPNYYPNSFSGPVDSVQKFGAAPVDKVITYLQITSTLWSLRYTAPIGKSILKAYQHYVWYNSLFYCLFSLIVHYYILCLFLMRTILGFRPRFNLDELCAALLWQWQVSRMCPLNSTQTHPIGVERLVYPWGREKCPD